MACLLELDMLSCTASLSVQQALQVGKGLYLFRAYIQNRIGKRMSDGGIGDRPPA